MIKTYQILIEELSEYKNPKTKIQRMVKNMVRIAELKDVERILDIIKDAKSFLKNLGVDQWQGDYPNKDTILNDISKNQLFVYEEEEVLGFIAIIQGIEETYNIIYNGKWLSDQEYITIHRIAVKEQAKKRNIGTKLFEYAIAYAKENNIRSVRVDTHKDNYAMQALINKEGFIKCGYIYLKDHSLRLAYEKLI